MYACVWVYMQAMNACIHVLQKYVRMYARMHRRSIHFTHLCARLIRFVLCRSGLPVVLWVCWNVVCHLVHPGVPVNMKVDMLDQMDSVED